MVVTEDQLDALQNALKSAQRERHTGLMVGLNRRFAPMVQQMRQAMPPGRPKQMIYRVNSGPIPTDSWLHNPEEGGGMLVGEMCHFIDLMQYIAGERPAQVYAQSLTLGRDDLADHDNLSITITFDGGSVGTLCYNTVGDSAAPKERLEVYGQGTVAVLNDFRRLEITQDGSTSTSRAWNQDKGQANQVADTIDSFCVQGRGPISFEELVAGMRAVFAASASLQEGRPVPLTPYEVKHVAS